jgi:hypothetical protein
MRGSAHGYTSEVVVAEYTVCGRWHPSNGGRERSSLQRYIPPSQTHILREVLSAARAECVHVRAVSLQFERNAEWGRRWKATLAGRRRHGQHFLSGSEAFQKIATQTTSHKNLRTWHAWNECMRRMAVKSTPSWPWYTRT